MESPLRKQIRSIMKDHKKRQVWYRIVTTLAVVVVFVTTYMLILPAITMENKAQCGITEHKHDANCYSTQYEKENVLSCTTKTLGVHEHTDACYDAEHKLICGYADFVIHKHDASCYDADGNLVCEIPEHTLHVHTAECYRTEKQLVCTQEESAGHAHTAECYTKTQGNLICGKEEHTHGEGCYDADGNLVCEKEEHAHTDECYEWNDVLTCTIPESAGHTHDASCYQDVQVLVCEEPTELHTHTDACYKDGVRICDKLELKEHQHTDACFKEEEVLVQTLVCDRVEHVHTDECYKGSGQETEEQSSVTSEEVTSGQSEEESSSEAASLEAITEEASSEQIEEISTEEAVTEESLEEASTEEISTEEISSEEESTEEVSEEEESTEKVSSEAETEEESSEEASTEEIETEETKESFDMWDLSVDGVLFIAYSDDVTVARENEEDFTSNESDIALYTAENNAIQLYAASAEPSGTNFRNFITSAEVQKIVNGKWQDATEFENGDNVKVKLTYTLPGGTVTPNNKSIWYQLPNGVVPNEDLSGIVYDKSNNPIGIYSIGKNGMIQITFDDDFATGKEITGDIFFAGKVESDNTKEDKKIEFGGDAESITIKKEKEEEVKTDIKIKKEGTLSDSKDKISYKVTISSSLGTGEKVKLDDYLTNGTYIEGSVKVTKSGNEISKDQYTLSVDNASDQRTLKISELPELNAGESYEITYDVTPGKRSANGELKVDNIASTNKNQNDTWSQTIKKTLISKSGKYDSDKNAITWTVTINPDGTDLKGYTISDHLDGKELNGYKATLKYSDGSTKEITLPYIFEESTTGEVSYEITYETDVDSSTPSGNVKNDATIEKDGDKYEAGSEVGYTHRDWDLQKYSDGSEKVKGQDKMIYKWKSTITLPDKNLSDLGEFTYEDTIGESEMHSASKSELESKLMQEIEFTYIDENGNKNTVSGAEIGNYFTYQIIYTPENVDAVSGFKIVFTPKSGLSIKGKEIVLKYSTNVDLSGVQPGSSTTFTNTAKVKDKEKKASVDYKKPIKIQKASSSEGALIPPTELYWETGNKYRGYMNSQVERKLGEDGYLYYRLILNLEEAKDIEIEDLLPIGTTYVEGSAFAAYCELNKYGMIEAIKYTGDPIKVEASTKKQTTEDNESYQELELKLTNIRSEQLFGHDNDGYIVVYYTVKVEDSAFGSDGKASLTNKATWEGESVENTTNVKKYEKIIEKSGKQVFDSEEKPLDAIEYRVVINPGASDLDVEKDTVTLVDTISYTKLYGVSLNLDTVKLYHYDSTKENKCGEEISPTRYQVRYDSDAGKMTVVLPDQLACVLVYQYNYDKGDLADLNDASVSNSVKLMGESSKSDITSLKVNESGATAHQNIEIYKVDSTDFTKKLPGAKFELEIWKDKTWQKIDEYTSGDGKNGTKLGEIELKIDSDDKLASGEIWKNYIYRLTEIEPPAGYAKRSEPYYFVRTDKEVKDSVDYYNLNLDEATKKSIHKISISGENIYIPNVASGLNIRKVWVNPDGSQISDPTGSIQVQLYKSTGTIDGINVTVKWNEGNEQKTIFIKRGSALVIRTALDYDIQYYSCNDENVVIKEYRSENNKRFLTVDGITKDCTINIKRWNVYPTFEYTEATDVTYDSPEKVGDPVTLNASNNWSYEWSNLDVGDGIYYYVEEVGTHSGYTVSYMNNGGIHSGEIVITNRMDEKPITLPETGGTGTYWYTLGGLLLIAGASLLMYRNSMRKGGKRNW